MTTEKQQVRKSPMLAQPDLRRLWSMVHRTLDLSESLSRSPTRAEAQLIALCLAILDIVQGSLGEDLDGEPLGDLELRPQSYLTKPRGSNGR